MFFALWSQAILLAQQYIHALSVSAVCTRAKYSRPSDGVLNLTTEHQFLLRVLAHDDGESTAQDPSLKHEPCDLQLLASFHEGGYEHFVHVCWPHMIYAGVESVYRGRSLPAPSAERVASL